MDLTATESTNAGLRVLLVRQSSADSERLEGELRAQGYEPQVTRIDSEPALLEALDRNEADVLLCGHAPPLDAFEVLRLVKERSSDLPFIIVSDAIAEATAIEVMRAGAHDFLFKHNLARLGAVIERELREAAMRAERRRMQQQLLLADRLSAVGTLAASVAHEINNPLAYVLGNIEFALGRLSRVGAPSADASEVMQALTHAREGSERIRATTRDLKVFCRTDEETRAPVNVRKVMESSINMAWNEIRHRGRLSKQFNAVPAVEGNENRLGQVFLNLLVNAAQALPDDRVEQNEVSVSVRADGYSVVVEVSDNGCGISAAQQARMFEPFFTTKPAGVGSGIGLSICRSIVHDLGGQIEVESALGQGSTFRVTLPALEASFNSHPPGIAALATRRARLMVIDDEPALCAVIKRLLAGEHDVHTFLHAGEALKSLRHDASFDLIFCDLMMPRMSGMEFHAQLSEQDPDLASRTVFLTGGVMNGPARQFLSAISNRVIEKPFTSHALEEAIAHVLDCHPQSGTWATSELREAR